jgi:DNA polymerase-3 subunit chi
VAAPCEVWFYHLERTALDQALPELLTKTLQKGWRALVRLTDPGRAEAIDTRLWTWRDDAFLPHGLATEPMAERQPILLTTGEDNPNAAQALFVLDGAEIGSLEPFERCILLFDGADPAALARAREQWKTLKASGAPVSYWREGETRGWEKQA